MSNKQTSRVQLEPAENCEFSDICKTCHPEKEMEERRKNCDSLRQKRCAVYWAFRDGYYGYDD